MIRARHTEPWNSFFQYYVQRKMRQHFRGPEMHHPEKKPEKSVLLVGNHFSWWDGFFALEAAKRFFAKKIHVMMLEEELRPRRFLSYAGAFSIAPGNRAALESLRYAAGLLTDPENMVVVFPQGKMRPHWERPLHFQSGWTRILEMAKAEASLWFQAALPVYGSEPRPLLKIWLQAYPDHQSLDLQHIEDAYNVFLEACFAQISKG
jgi:1-acyl-sn-glycerol-3-phosphate acyltransferase